MVVLPSSFSQAVKSYESCLSFITLNCRSAKSKIEELDTFFNSLRYSFSVIILTETWYDQLSQMYTPAAYSHFFVTRRLRRGGGVSVLVGRDLNCYLEAEFTCVTDDYETVAVLHGSQMFVGFYRPPAGCLTAFYAFLERMLAFATENKIELVIGGDFNINMLETDPKQDTMLSIINSNAFEVVRTSATRITDTSSSLLDFFITNHALSSIKADVISADISDHLPVYMLINKQSERTKRKQTKLFQDVSDENMFKFRTMIISVPWTNLLESCDADLAYESFIESFSSVYHKCFPVKTVKETNKIRKPWISKDIYKQIKQKNRLYARFIKTRDRSIWAEYKHKRNSLVTIIRNAKTAYYNAVFSQNADRPDLTWKAVNTVLNRSQPKMPIDTIFRN